MPIRQRLRALVRLSDGQDLIEYGLLIGMISAGIVAAIAPLSTKVAQPFQIIAGDGNPGNGNPGGNPGNGNPGNPGNGNPNPGNPGNGNPGNSNPVGNPGSGNPGNGNGNPGSPGNGK